MRDGRFELVVARRASNSSVGLGSFDERVIKGISYAVAEPGVEYCVKVNVYRGADGKFSPARLRIGLYVDGNDVQYWKRIDLSQEYLLPKDVDIPVSATFWGFKKDVTDMRSFEFAIPKAVSTGVNGVNKSDIQAALGKIHAVIYEAVVVGGTFKNRDGFHDVPADQSISDGKKFWQQASLSTSAGKKLPDNFEQFNALEKWTNDTPNSSPLHTMTLHYHTDSMLNCINELSNTDDNSSSSAKRPFNGKEDSSKRAKKAPEFFDLTGDDDDDVEDDKQNKQFNITVVNHIRKDSDSNISSSSSESSTDIWAPTTPSDTTLEVLEVIYEDADNEVQYIEPVPKEYSLIDISGEEEREEIYRKR